MSQSGFIPFKRHQVYLIILLEDPSNEVLTRFEDNIQLSTLRAANVRKELLASMGKEYANRIGVAGYGDTRLKNTEQPVSPDNRRIEIRLLWKGQSAQ